MRTRRAAAILVMAAAALLPGCSTSNSATPATTTTTSTSTTKASGCDYRAGQPAPPGKDVGLPTGSEPTSGSAALRTNQGEITVTLAGSTAPCTVRSFAHLASKKYFDSTTCHRLTTTEGLKVLQCGDPAGTGRGGPGYTIPDENPTDLAPGQASPDGRKTVIYPRGSVAMANTGQPHSGGSQFFIVYGDSTLPATYAVFGKIDAAGLAVLDKIAAAGLDPVNGPNDGSPKSAVTIQQAVVGS